MPITYRNINFKTSPEINHIFLNKEMNFAKVEMRLVSTGLELKLNKVNGKWTVNSIKELWIE